MKRKILFIFGLLLSSFIVLSLSINGHAQATYELELNEDDSFIWEVEEVRPRNFEKVFGFEPAFEVGDETQKKVVDVIDTSYGWSVVLEEWDYNSNFQGNGTIRSDVIYSEPEDYEDNVFIPTPANDYLTEAAQVLPSEYIIEGLRVTKRFSNYDMILEYNAQGIKILEQYVDDDGIILVSIEATFNIIPLGNYFMGFIIVGVLAIVYAVLKHNKIKIR